MSRDHLTLETLLELEDGLLAPAAAGAARAHLQVCAACRERSRGLNELPEPPDAAAIGAGPEDQAAAWRELQQALPADAPAEAFRPPPAAARRRPAGFRLAAAAGLLLAAGGLYRLTSSPGPAPVLTAAASIQLLPVGFAQLGSAAAPAPATCPAPQESFVIVLGGLEPGSAPEQRDRQIALAGPGGPFETQAPVNDFGEIVLVLSRSALGNGDYQIRVRNPAADGAPIQEYRWILDCP